METDEKPRGSPPGGGGREEGYSGGHLCHVCGYMYPNPHPSAKLRRSHRKNCGKNGGTKAAEREVAPREHNGGKPLLGEGEGEGEGNGASQAYGGVGLRGSGQVAADLVGNQNNAAPVVNGTNVLVACTDDDEIQTEPTVQFCEDEQLADGHLSEPAVSPDRYLDASTSFQQPESEDGTMLEAELSVEIKNLDVASLTANATSGEVSAQTNGVYKGHFSREPITTDLSANSKVENEVDYHLESESPEFSGPDKVIVKLEGPYDFSVNVNNDDMDVFDYKCNSAFTSECSEGHPANCNNIPFEIAPEDNGTCVDNDGIQTEVTMQFYENVLLADGHRSESAVSSDLYHDASTSIHQPESEDGATLKSEFSGKEIKDLNITLQASSASAGEISSQATGLCEGNFAMEPGTTDLSTSSKVGNDVEYHLESKTPELDGSGEVTDTLKEAQYECSGNVNGDNIDTVNSKSDEASVYCELTGYLSSSNVQLLHKISPLSSDFESQSTCSRNEEGFMEDNVDVLRSIFEMPPRPEVIGSDNVESETVVESSDDVLQAGNEGRLIHTENNLQDCSIEIPSENRSVKYVSGVQLSVLNSCEGNSEDATVGWQNDLAVTEIEGMINTNGKGKPNEEILVNSSELDFSFHEKTQTKIVEEHSTISVEEDPSIKKPNEEFSNEEIEYKEHDKLILCNSKDQVSTSEEPFSLLVDQESCIKKPVSIDDAKSDDLFELTTDSCHLEAPNTVESKQQIDSTSVIVDQRIVSNQKSISEEQHCLIVDECTHAESSTSERGPPLCPEVVSVSCTADLANNICSEHSVQENGAWTSDFTSVPSQVIPVEQSTLPASQEINAVQISDNDEKKLNEEITAKEINSVQSTDDLEGNKQNEEISAKGVRSHSDKNHVPLKVLLAEASAETKEKKTSTKDRVLSFRRLVSKDDALSAKSESPKAGSNYHDWNSPARLPHDNIEKRSKGRKQPWVPFICCSSMQ